MHDSRKGSGHQEPTPLLRRRIYPPLRCPQCVRLAEKHLLGPVQNPVHHIRLRYSKTFSVMGSEQNALGVHRFYSCTWQCRNLSAISYIPRWVRDHKYFESAWHGCYIPLLCVMHEVTSYKLLWKHKRQACLGPGEDLDDRSHVLRSARHPL